MGDGFVVMAAQVKWPVVLVAPSFVKAAEGALRCVSDPDAYHGGGTTPEGAEALCRGCVCLLECRAYAVENGEFGVWGGPTEAERRVLRRSVA